ncbi:MAG: Asp-tRNA(Asn)/Glu-tRNA(Gln) amidotransferase subunit GatC [Chitinophagaceae bacterium]
MQVTEQLIDKLAHLARLRFDAAEKSMISADLEKMIQFVEKLNELDLDGVEPLMHMSESSNVLRDDKVQGSISREAALRNAPDNDGSYFRVPKVIRK